MHDKILWHTLWRWWWLELQYPVMHCQVLIYLATMDEISILSFAVKVHWIHKFLHVGVQLLWITFWRKKAQTDMVQKMQNVNKVEGIWCVYWHVGTSQRSTLLLVSSSQPDMGSLKFENYFVWTWMAPITCMDSLTKHWKKEWKKMKLKTWKERNAKWPEDCRRKASW